MTTEAHFNTAPGYPQTRVAVRTLSRAYLEDFMGKCSSEPADFANCLACYAYRVLCGLDGEIPAPAKTGPERHTDLKILLSVPHFGKPADDMKAAERVLRHLHTGLGSNVRAELVVDGGGYMEGQVSHRPVSRVDDASLMPVP